MKIAFHHYMPMKCLKFFVLICFALFLTPVLMKGQNADWENPSIPSRNVVKPHAWFLPNQPMMQSLDGMWRFKIVQNPSLRSLDFFKDTKQTKDWGQIKVPAHWQTEGYDKYIFTDVEYPIPPNPPFVPKDYNPVGSYQRDFILDPAWAGKQVFIHLGAVNSFFYIWINGQPIGFSKDSKTPTEFDITKVLKKGKNTVSLQVFRFSDATYLEGQDMWKLSGIERGVFLIARPVFHIADFRIKATLDSVYKNGLFDLNVEFNRQPAKTETGSLKVELTDVSGKTVFQEKQLLKTVGSFNFASRINEVKAWNAEHPNLYTLTIRHLNAQGAEVESITRKIGFRTAEVKGGLFLLNGQAIKIKGVNRHEHNMLTGKVITEADMLRDIRLMKQMNINAVRASHYPNGERWYELCDQYGLYVIDEVNLECDGMSFTPMETLSGQPEWINSYMDRTQRMWERDKNFTCIITWSLGNESGFGANFVATYNWIKSKDKTRPVQYEATKDERYSDIYCPMYKSINIMENYVKTWRSRPMIQCEYAHMMGNSGGNLKDDWDLIYKHKQLQGGFIWDFSDQTFARKDEKGNKIWAYGRDMGTVGLTSDTSFCADGLLNSDRTFHPQAYELQKVYQNISFDTVDLKNYKFNIRNRFDFTNLSAYGLRWFIKGDGMLICSGKLPEVLLGPQEEKEVNIEVPAFEARPGVEYFLTLEAYTESASGLLDKDFIIAKEQFKLPFEVKLAVAVAGKREKLKKQVEGEHLRLYGKDIMIGFNQKTGLLEAYEILGRPVIQQALEPHFWRAATDNDIGNSLQIRSKVWQNAFQTAELKSFKNTMAGKDRAVIETIHELPAVGSTITTRYTIYSSGDVEVSYNMKTGTRSVAEPQRIGMRVILNPEFDQASWLGKGPFDNYADRNYAAHTDVYRMPADSLFYPYPRAQESGYRTSIRWVALQNSNGEGLMAIAGTSLLSTGILHFDMKHLDFDKNAPKNVHGGSMKNENLIWWNIDHQQMGVGGDNSWGAQTHPQYRLPYQNYAYSFTLRPIFKNEQLTEKSKP
ncbi:glycoside hydrolase family 2 TIM barrel-domain containing protein [Pedobacter sp.]|jgi:beta-galactosidase|uniref:glycoside hydrolase family 2 TIM barrel-domain containing protein n=1 Tax=Pedobacter sp. TaxID=1411316 RepID=UPI002BE5EF80|nr:glycoside hydrolase family 2 TIM barrel-domain containing protein [Pedobacter sp.]HWW39520.1 glycoside hydrolase family 2 TIM barrel-domain containing protein [Pedobacter sp.]